MTKFRRNHTRSERNSGGMIIKVGVFAAMIGSLFFFFNKGIQIFNTDHSEKALEIPFNENNSGMLSIPDEYLPSSSSGEMIKRLNYTLSYSETHEQAEWVAYKLTKKSIQFPYVDRTNDFRPDPKVKKGSASPRDYFQTGYDRGHLVPAGDMNFDKRAMSETFYMSNISPQIRNFNGGIWRELEESVRDWAYDNEEVFIVTGPVLTKDIRERIGDNRVAVPDLFYKVILDLKSPESKAIAFLLPNEVSDKPLRDYVVTIDDLEAVTGIDFFYQLLTSEPELELERNADIEQWRISEKRQELRIEKWNTRK